MFVYGILTDTETIAISWQIKHLHQVKTKPELSPMLPRSVYQRSSLSHVTRYPRILIIFLGASVKGRALQLLPITLAGYSG